MRNRKKVDMRKRYFALVLFALSNPVAASILCEGKADLLFLTRSGNIELYSSQIYGSGDGRYVCNVSGLWKDVSADTCKAWYAAMLTKISSGKPIKLYYASEEVASCSAIPTYSSAFAPYGIGNQ